ncbi:MAG: WYL domain-containing protein [Agathobacter sp.]|nr:WYL domain-containing protein [Agathobacter sp.]
MPRGTNQKFKFTYLMKIMQEKTDDEHSLTMPQIMEELEKYDVTAERKSIYTDFQDMTEKFGVEIIKEQIGRETYYHVGTREFELAEVKLLIDAIQSSKFITQTKSRELITKIKSFVSEHQAKQLQRQVYINDRVKTMNESVYYNVDDIHTAINQNKKIRFKYYKWDINKKLVPRHNGDWFVVSPWALTWDDENYYMVAFDNLDHKIKHYRVDKMMHIFIEEEMRDGKEAFKNFDMAEYSKATFGMYQGQKTKVKIRLANNMCGIFIDRFGKEISFRPIDDEHSELHVDVNVSPQFFGWIFSLGKDVKVVGPEEVVEELRAKAEEFLENLNNESFSA